MDAVPIPVVLNSSFQDSPVLKRFSELRYKVILSRTTEKNSVILPKSSLAILVYDIRDLVKQPLTSSPALSQFPPALEEAVLSLMKSFAALNRNSIGVLISDGIGLQPGRKIFHELQRQFLTSSFAVMMVDSIQECVECITTIASKTTKSAAALCAERLKEISNLGSAKEDCIYAALQCAGVSQDDVYAVQHGCGNLKNVITAGREFLLDNTNLDLDTACAVELFFEKELVES